MSDNTAHQKLLKDSVLQKKFVEYVFVIFGAFLIAGIGYFIPALRYEVPSAEEQNKFINRFIPKTLPKENALIQPVYDAYLEQKIKDVLIPLLGEDAVRAVVRAELEIQKKKIIEETAVPSVQKKEANLMSAQTIRKTVTDVTKYNVKHLNAFVFMAPPVEEQYKRFFKEHKTDLLQTARMVIGYSFERGDTFQVIDFPETLPFAPVALKRIQYHQMIAVALITTTVLAVFLIALFRYMTKHRQKQIDFSFLKEKEADNMYCRQIIGSPDENLVLQVQNLCSQMPEIAVNALRNRLYDHSSFKAGQDSVFSPAQQAAVILLCLGNKGVRLMFKQMSEAEIKAFSHIMAKLGRVKAMEIHPILMRFCRQMMHPQDIAAPREQTKALLRANLTEERAQALIKELDKPVFGHSVWHKLNKATDSQISAFLAHEYPQTSAEILYHLSAEKAARVLKAFSIRSAAEILLRIGAFGEECSQSVFSSFGTEEEKSNSFSVGEMKAAAVLSLTEAVRRKKILEYISQTAPQAADMLSKRLITFDDFAFWSEDDLKCLLKQTDEETLIVALSHVSDTVKEAFVRVIDPKKWVVILQKTTQTPIESIQKIEEAQARMIQQAQLLIDTRKCKGKIL